MTDKQDMVKSGKIEDLRIFKLMYLEKSISETKLLGELKKRALNDQIEQLKTERQSMARSFELRIRTLSDEVVQLRTVFEDSYEIKLSEWGYDDSTGVLVSLQPTELKAVQSQAALQKGVDVDKNEEKKKRRRRNKKNSVEQPEEPIIKDGVEQKPPDGSVEA